MFYKTTADHGLAHDPFKALIAPRPIGWISTLGADGVPNLAPYSFFNAVSDSPKLLMFASAGMKDSAQNAVDSGEFTHNLMPRALIDQMNISSGFHARDQDEFTLAGLQTAPGETVACPRVAAAPAALECKVVEVITPRTLDGAASEYIMVIGQVTGIFIDDAYVNGGRFDTQSADLIARCGYRDYAGMDTIFELARPAGGGD